MATLLPVLHVILIISGLFLGPIHGHRIGIDYGQIADNLPAPSSVVSLLTSLNITRARIYDSNPDVLSAFANTTIELIIGLQDKYIVQVADPARAREWVRENVAPYANLTNIQLITVGNEVLTSNDTQMMAALLPAMRNLQNALDDLHLTRKIQVSTPHSFSVMAVSFPPSAGSFRPELLDYIVAILGFLSQTDSPFMININPYFAYRDDPDHVSLDYVLFQPNPGQTDPLTNLHYDNMFDAQMDSVYSALRASTDRRVTVFVTESGWPSRGRIRPATVENARLYNGNLLKRVENNTGTPLRPSTPIEAYIFALFNEDLKPGPETERNYGLYYPNMTPVYDIGLQGGGGIESLDYTVSGGNEVGGLSGLYVSLICFLVVLLV